MSAELLGAWQTSLTELGDLGAVLRDAIEGDNALGAIATMYEMRRVRSALARVEAPATLVGNGAEAAAIGDVAMLVGAARRAEITMQQWLTRPLPGDAALLTTPLGTAALADAILPEVWDSESDLVVLVGAGLGGVAQILCDLGQKRIVTLDGDGDGDGDALRTQSIEELSATIRTLVPNAPQQFTLKAALTADRERVEAAAEAVRDVLGDLRIHRNTVRAFSETWVEQGLANLPALGKWPSVAAVGDAFAGKPMVIVAPGPSLANNAALLRGLQGKAIITCFSHSLKPVLAAGVVPDFVVTVDPQDVRYHFAGCDLSQTCLVNAATVHPSLFDLPAKRFLTLSANCAIDDWIFDALGEDALVPGGGSVATSAFSLALRWKCDPIIFVGLDLSFPGGQYYVSTSSDGNARANVVDGVMRVEGWSPGFTAMKTDNQRGDSAPERVVELPGWHGGTVPSSHMFGLFHRWFVERMKHVGDTRVLNCTEGGAAIAGMEHVPLRDAGLIDEVSVSAMLDEIIHPHDVVRIALLSDHLDRYGSGMRCARSLAGRAKKLIDAGDTGATLERVERILAASMRPLQFVSLLAQREVDRAFDVARRYGCADDYLAASRRLLDTLLGAIGTLEPAMTRARTRLGEVGNGCAGNGSAGNGSAGNGSAGNGSAGNGSA